MRSTMSSEGEDEFPGVLGAQDQQDVKGGPRDREVPSCQGTVDQAEAAGKAADGSIDEEHATGVDGAVAAAMPILATAAAADGGRISSASMCGPQSPAAAAAAAGAEQHWHSVMASLSGERLWAMWGHVGAGRSGLQGEVRSGIG